MIEQLQSYRRRRDAAAFEARQQQIAARCELFRIAVNTPAELDDSAWQVVSDALDEMRITPQEVVRIVAQAEADREVYAKLEEARRLYNRAVACGDSKHLHACRLSDCLQAHDRLEAASRKYPLIVSSPGQLPEVVEPELAGV